MSGHRKPPLPASMTRRPQLKGVCRWCDQPVLTADGKPCARKWHAECVEAFKLIHWPAETRRAVMVRDHGICARCGRDCELQRRQAGGLTSLDNWFIRAEAVARFGVWGNHWSSEEGMRWTQEQRRTQRKALGLPNGTSYWQHDHIRPLIEANGDLSFWQLSNIQTLCTACHVEKGCEDNARRRAAKVSEKPAELLLI